MAVSWPEEGFCSDPNTKEASRVPYRDYYKNVPISSLLGSESEIHFPDTLDELFSIYFALDGDRKQAFYAACHLWAQGLELRIRAPSMALVAFVSAIETLVNFMDNPGPSCQECGAPSSIEICKDSRAPRYRLTSRFKQFLKEFAGSGLKCAAKLYKYRSNISHDGDLLREELLDSGFTKGGDDEQMIFRHEINKVTHIALVNWLISQAEQ